MTEYILWFVGALIVVLPICVYLCVKLATLGYLNAQWHFKKIHPTNPEQETINGDK